MTLPPVVIVPDPRDGARAWERVAHLAQQFAGSVVAVEPGGESLAADAAALRATLAAAVEPPVVLAHGYGALVATLAATAQNASHLIFVAGYMLDYGETIYDVVGGTPVALNRTPVDMVGWRTLPTTYVACTADRRIAPAVQERLAQTRATTLVTLDAGEHPFHTHAGALAQIVHEELVALRGGAMPAARALGRSA